MIHTPIYILLLFVAPPSPNVTVSSPPVTEAGQPLSLTCTATVIPHLTMHPLLEWVGPNSPFYFIMDLVGSGETFSRTLMFGSLRTSHGGQYSCRATINITYIQAVNMETVNVTVQSKSVCMCIVGWAVLSLLSSE